MNYEPITKKNNSNILRTQSNFYHQKKKKLTAQEEKFAAQTWHSRMAQISKIY